MSASTMPTAALPELRAWLAEQGIARCRDHADRAGNRGRVRGAARIGQLGMTDDGTGCRCRGADQAIRQLHRCRPARSQHRARARSSASSARTAPANPPPSACCADCCGRAPGAPRWPASMSAASRRRCARISATCRRNSRSTATSPCARICAFSAASTGCRAARSRSACASRCHGGAGRARGRAGATLAGGWKQRLALGCAILHRPPVLFLDEPTSGVEPEARRRFWDLIHHLASEGVTILVSTHYMDEAEYCNRIALINAGRLVAIGSPGELRQRELGGDAVRTRLRGARRGAAALRQAPGVIDASIFGDKLHVLVQQAQRRRRSAAVAGPAGHHGRIRRAPSRRAWRTCSSNSSPRPTGGGGRRMNLRRLFAIAFKETLQIWRDPRSLAIALLMPLHADGAARLRRQPRHQARAALRLRSGAQPDQPRRWCERFVASGWFVVVRNLNDERAVRDAMDRGTCIGAVTIPVDFSRMLATHRHGRGADGVRCDRRQHDHHRHRLRPGRDRADDRRFRSALGRGARRPAARRRQRRSRAAGLVQRRPRQPQFHHPGRGRGHPRPGRRPAHLAHRLARVGARHDGAAHFDPGDRARGHDRQAHALFRDRPARRGVLPGRRRLLVPGAVSRQPRHAASDHRPVHASSCSASAISSRCASAASSARARSRLCSP